MSGPSGAPSPAQRSASIGPNAGAMGMPPQPQPTPGGMGNASSSAGGGGGQQQMSQQNLNQIVIEYLNKKGYSKTEAMLRMESSNQEADPNLLPKPSNDADRVKYAQAFGLLHVWIEDNLDVYKPELRRILWPVFVYSFLRLVEDGFAEEAKRFFEAYKDNFHHNHEHDLRQISTVSLKEHLQDNGIAQTYRTNKYRFTMSTPSFHNLIMFLESKQKQGGGTILQIMQSMQINTVERAAEDRFSLAAMLARYSADDQDLMEDEGIPGHRPGAPNIGSVPDLLPKLKLGNVEMEADKRTDVRAELAEEDLKHPPAPGDKTFVQEFDQMIKAEDDESVESPQLHDVPYPKPTLRDVALEVQRVKENRDRFKIEGRTGGVGPGVTVCMFTLHNTYDSITCVDIDDAQLLLAAGTQDSVIRIWSVEGKPLPCILPPELDRDHGFNSRRLIGHAGPVYGVHFQPSAGNYLPTTNPDFDTRSKWLLSCSCDTTIGLWNLDTYQMMVQYKGHCQPVWDVKWGPHGHYFLTGGHDKTARLWTTDNISAIRIFAGHDNDVDVVCFHPNTAYVFSGSCDKTVRMWSVTTGNPVRMFTGHAGNLTALACSPSGKILASADDSGTICLWDLAPGRLLKRMRGHGKGGIWSLSWSVESTVITSGGADGTVRVWDVHGPATDVSQGKVVGEGGTGAKIDVGPSAGGAGATAGKKKGNVVVTPDQISAFPTKKTPVLKVKFSHMNLICAAGAYSPNN